MAPRTTTSTIRRNQRHQANGVTSSSTPLAGGRHSPDPRPELHSAAVAASRLDRGTAGFQPGDRHPERRAGDVVQSDLMEKVHGVGVAAVLTADTELEILAGRSALLHRYFHQAADAVGVQCLERRHPEDAEIDV